MPLTNVGVLGCFAEPYAVESGDDLAGLALGRGKALLGMDCHLVQLAGRHVAEESWKVAKGDYRLDPMPDSERHPKALTHLSGGRWRPRRPFQPQLPQHANCAPWSHSPCSNFSDARLVDTRAGIS
jgi:hypothetical protein